MSVTTKAAILSVAVASIAALAYMYRNDISEELECLCSDSKKEAALRKLQRFRVALKDLATDVHNAELALNKVKENKEEVSPEVRRMVTVLSVDMDYIFDTLDAVTGDMAVKERRKKLVDEFKELAHRVDVLNLSLK